MNRASGRPARTPNRRSAVDPVPSAPRSAAPAKASGESEPKPRATPGRTPGSEQTPGSTSVAGGGADRPLWERVIDLAAEKTADSALVDQVHLIEEGTDRVRLKLQDGVPSGGSWIQSRVRRLEDLLQEVSGVHRRVELVEPDNPAPKPPASEPDPAISGNPVIRTALELFEATIHSVRELPKPDSIPPGDTEDV